uniref:Uncharacterized protein n=1 Tax=Callorhinchus milii TaxID=7868 RepID=A0A4W3JT86_CALMI
MSDQIIFFIPYRTKLRISDVYFSTILPPPVPSNLITQSDLVECFGAVRLFVCNSIQIFRPLLTSAKRATNRIVIERESRGGGGGWWGGGWWWWGSEWITRTFSSSFSTSSCTRSIPILFSRWYKHSWATCH